MSYAATFPYRSLGYIDSLPPLPNPKSVVIDQMKASGAAIADESKRQAIAFAEQQIANYPPATAVMAEYQKYAGYLKQISGFNPKDMADPAKCVELLKQALIIYARENGIPTNTEELKQKLANYALQIATGATGIQIPAGFPSNLSELKDAAINLACTAFLMTTGVDPRILTVTVEALLDGKLDQHDCESIGSTAGAIAGAVACQAFGIPAPVGAFIGGLVGGMVGGTFAQIFGLTDAQAVVRAMQKAFDDYKNAVLSQAQTACAQTRSAYWDVFDNLILKTELQWELAEQKIGWKFGLRWYGTETWTFRGQPFSHGWVPSLKNFTGPVTTANRAVVFQKNINHGYYTTEGDKLDVASYGCPFDYGCPYPWVSPPIFGEGAFLERDAQAYLARGALYVPQSQRPATCSFAVPASDAAFNGEAKERWLKQIREQLQAETAAVGALQVISVAVVGDLVKTSATVQAEKAVHDMLSSSSAQLNAAWIQRSREYAAAKRTGAQLSDLFNYGALIAGIGVLGVVLMQKRKQRA